VLTPKTENISSRGAAYKKYAVFRFGRDLSLQSARGFTLIEVMVVIAILAAVVAVGAPKLFNSSSQMRSSVRRMAIMTRDVRNIARLYNSTARMVFSMPKDKTHSYWVESASGNVTLMSEDQEQELEKLTKSQREDEQPKNEFEIDARVTKEAIDLPRGLFFEGVEYDNRKEMIGSGVAYVHFFPQGLAEGAAIHLTNRKTLNWTIAINPLTGRAEVYERKISLKELRAR
jgi:general secretion pathway protein H